MLRNLAASEQQRLLECFNEIWQPGQVMDAMALARLDWVARARGFLVDKQTGFRGRRCTADSIADMVSTVEDAKAGGDLVMLLVIDVQDALDSLPHTVVQQGLDLLGICGNLQEFLSSFLHNHTLRGVQIPWSKALTYLGLRIDHRLTWLPATNALCTQTLRFLKAISQLLARVQGCTTRWALQLFEAVATSRLLYALPLVALPPPCLRKLGLQHRSTMRVCLGVPRTSQVAAILAEAGTWALSLLFLQQGLRHVDRLHHAADDHPLLTHLRSRPASHMGRLCGLYKEVIGHTPANAVHPRPPHRPPIPISTGLPGDLKYRSATCALQQTASSLLQERLGDHLHIFVDGSVIPETGSSTAACVAPALQKSMLCRLPGHASSTAAELAGLHLAVDLLAEALPATPAAIFCESKATLLCLQNPDRDSLGIALLSSRLTTLQDAGCSLSLHWLPAHVGIPANEEADTLAKSAQHSSVPFSPAVTAADFLRLRLRRHIIACHPDKRASLGRPLRPLPQHGLLRRDASLLLRLQVGCY
ncbi:uncharacterized protein [Dermacentor albipictus]|uniref:uncharacterized protein n=1 Tax=Dermacentor albipictus TaxID=60249 RepID=UPI0038FBE5E8